eukprot:scaffold228475_cov21-Tisochrysis_lutea.AAC.1
MHYLLPVLVSMLPNAHLPNQWGHIVHRRVMAKPSAAAAGQAAKRKKSKMELMPFPFSLLQHNAATAAQSQ